MTKSHLKRLTAPRSWVLLRKENTFITRPKPGRSFDLAMPMSQVMKALLNKATTRKEVRTILLHQEVLVNGKRVYDHRRPVGFMDVVSFPKLEEYFVLTLTEQGRLQAVSIDKKAAQSRIVKIRGKTSVKGKVQINCNDGTNITIDKNAYKTGDSLVISGTKISKYLPFKEGSSIILTGGKHQSKVGTVTSITDKVVVFSTSEGEFSTAKRHAFVVGEKQPEVTLQ